jgi:C4-dicarboxylate-specific signal transduction histidine kinase
VQDIIDADVRAANVIRRLRAILRQGPPELEPIAAAELVEKVLNLAKPDLDSAEAQVTVSIPKRLPVFQGDRIPLEQVLLNILKNACEAFEKDSPQPRRISISCSVENQDIVFSIRDNGCGLPENSAEIFDAFRTTKPNGLGLGLKICRSIVHAHGGRIWALPNKGRGAKLHFSIPLNLGNP